MPSRLILVADSHRPFVASVASELTKVGHRVMVAHAVSEVLSMIRAQPPDLVLTGLDLPGGGAKFVRRLAADLCHPVAPVVVIVDDIPKYEIGESDLSWAAAIIHRDNHAGKINALVGQLLGDDKGKPNTAAGRQPLRVLIVESDPNHRQTIAQCLAVPGREPINVEHADTASQAMTAISCTKFSCILLSHALTDGFGLDVIQSMDDRLLTTPVIALSPIDDPAQAISYFRAGCAEVLVWPKMKARDGLRHAVADMVALFQRRAIATILERQQLQQGIVETQEGLIALARTDPLMGICNRGVFDDYHETQHRLANSSNETYTLLMIDVDRFKQFNDQYGHSAGDEALRATAHALMVGLREHDFIARYGGEEIVVLLDKVGPALASRVAERYRNMVFDRHIVHAGNPPHDRITVSIGAATFIPGSAATTADILVQADQAMYAAKAAGRNRVMVAPLLMPVANPEPLETAQLVPLRAAS